MPFSRQASNKQQQAAANTRKMGKIMVVGIWSKFWWMIPIGMKYDHTRLEQDTQHWQPGMGVPISTTCLTATAFVTALAQQ